QRGQRGEIDPGREAVRELGAGPVEERCRAPLLEAKEANACGRAVEQVEEGLEVLAAAEEIEIGDHAALKLKRVAAGAAGELLQVRGGAVRLHGGTERGGGDGRDMDMLSCGEFVPLPVDARARRVSEQGEDMVR